MGSHYAAFRTTKMKVVLVLFALSTLLQGTVGYGDEVVSLSAPGFRMKSVVQDVGTQQIVVQLVVSGGNDVVPIIYMPKDGSPEAYLDVQTNPCAGVEKNKLCCLRSMRNMYDMDLDWVDKLDLAVMQSCNSSATPYSSENVAVFDGETFTGVLSESTVLQGGSDNAIPGVVYSYGRMLSDDGINNETVITLRMATTYVEPRSKVTDMSMGTYKYEFFVGIVFATLRDSSPDIYTTVIQQHIEFTKSDFGFFAIGTEQDRSILKQVATFIHEAKNPSDIVDGVVDPATGGELYQYMEVYVDYDDLYVEGTKSVKVMMDTLKFAQRATSPTGPSDWTFPCTSFYTTQADSWTDLLSEACLPDTPTFCSETFSNGRFWVPFDTSTATTDEGYVHGINRGVTIFFAFEIVFSDSADSSEFVETVYATINVDNFPVLQHCDGITVIDYEDVTDTISVKVTLGTGTPVAEGDDTGMDLTTRGENGQVNKITATAASYGAAVMSVVIDGLSFSELYSTKFQVDNLMIFNFLGASNSGFENVMTQISSGTGLTIEKESGNDHFSIIPNFGEGLDCEEALEVNNGISCLWRRAVVADTVASIATQSIYYLSSATPTSASVTWVWDSFFPDDDTDANAVTFLKLHCPKAYPTDDGVGGTVPAEYQSSAEGAYGCIFVDPGYRWTSKGGNTINNPLMISDKTVVIAVITIKPMDYTNGDTGRRLLSMNSDGSGMRMHPLSTFGMGDNRLRTVAQGGAVVAVDNTFNHNKVVSSAVMQTELVTRYANSLLSNPRVLSPKEMRIRLKAAFTATRHTTRHTALKIKPLGNTALSRHLLQSIGSDELDPNKFQGESASNLLVMENPHVCDVCNLVTIYDYDKAPAWRVAKFRIDKPADVDWDIFKTNIANTLKRQAPLMVAGAEEGRTVGFTSVDDSDWGSRRRMLEVTAHNGLATTVDVDAIFKMDTGFGKLFRTMFACILKAASTSKVVITTVDSNATAAVCHSTGASNAGAEVETVRDALLTRCGNGTKVLSPAICNKLYQTFLMTAPSVAVDWYRIKPLVPKIFFKFHTTTPIYPSDDAGMIYRIREIVSATMAAPMEKVVVEVRDKKVMATSLVVSRRLLSASHDMVVFVWVYQGGGTTGDPEWPGAGITNMLTKYTADYRPELKSALDPSLLANVVFDAAAETGPKFSMLPFQPTLHEYSVTFMVDFKLTRTTDTHADIIAMKTTIKKVFAVAAGVTETDVRVLSFYDASDASRPALAVEIRVSTEDKMTELGQKLRSDATDIDKDLLKNIKDGDHFSAAEAVTIRIGTIRGTKDTKTVKISDASPVLLIVIIIGSVLFALAVVAYCFTSQKLKKEEVDPMPTAPNGMASQISYMHVPRQDAAYPQFYQPQVDMYGRPLV
jgi:hypothetical protein